MARWRVFVCSGLVTLFCLVPLYLLLIGSSLFGATAVETPAEGVSITTPDPEDELTLLLVAQTPDPAAVLVRLDAWQQQAECLILPENTVLLQNGSPVTLTDCYASAGPLQLRSCLNETAGAAPERYLALSSDALAEVFGEFSPVMSWDELGEIKDLTLLRRFAFNGGQGALTSSTAALLLRQSGLNSAEQASLRAAIYGTFLQEGLTDLAEPVCTLLRSDEEMLTDITAVDIYGIERLLTLLADNPPKVTCTVVDGRSTKSGWEISQAGLTQLQQLLGAPVSEEEPEEGSAAD